MNAMAKADGDARKVELAPGRAMPALPASLSQFPLRSPRSAAARGWFSCWRCRCCLRPAAAMSG